MPTVRVTDEDYERLFDMRNSKRRFIKDVITHLINFYDENKTPSKVNAGPCGKTFCTSVVACDWCLENPELQTMEETAK